MKKYDGVIIGGGHNGLVCAAYLARAGKKILVLEQRPVFGGACVTEEVHGCKVSRASYVYSLFHPKIVKELDLKKHGLELLERDPPSFTPFKDGSYLLLYQDIKKCQEEIAKFSKKDAEKYPEYEQTLDKISRFVDNILLATPPNPHKVTDWPKIAKLGFKALGLKKDLYTLVELLSSSAYDFTSKYFESDQLLSTLCTDGIIGTCGGPYTPETAYVLLHHVMGEVNGHRGRWGYVRGGMGGLTQAIINVGKQYGVEYKNNSDVSEIIIKNNRAVGVSLVGGEEIYSKLVLSNADPKNTFEKLIKSELPSDFLSDIKNIDYSNATSKVNLILGGELKFNCYDGFVPGTFHICEDCNYIEKAFDDSKYGRISENLVLEGCMPTMVDKTLAPEGKHILSLLVQYTPYNLSEGDWTEKKDILLAKTIDKLAEYSNIKDVVEHADVLTPVDLENTFRLTKGNLFQGAMSLKQLFSMRPVPGFADYKTPIKNLYLCGSAVHPGGGVTGIPGHNVAKKVLKKWF